MIISLLAMREIRSKSLIEMVRQTASKTKEAITGKHDIHKAYDEDFFALNLIDSRPQAEWLAPRIADAFSVKSVVDYGCATGHWIDAFLRTGIDARGIEGSSAAKDALVCPANRFTLADLRHPAPQISDAFVDLSISIGVSEHIEERFADNYLDNIIRCRPRIVLLTVPPNATRGHNHVNERPRSYWISRMFARGYLPDSEKAETIARLIAQGRQLREVPLIMQHPTIVHWGVWFSDAITKNLIVFSAKS